MSAFMPKLASAWEEEGVSAGWPSLARLPCTYEGLGDAPIGSILIR